MDLLRSDVPDFLSDKTSKLISNAWAESQSLARIQNHSFEFKHRINSINILGHLNNLGFFIETLVNRHLLFLKQTGLIDDLSYARISIAKAMERIIFILKEDLLSERINLNEIVNLFRLRNKTIHYTPDNADALNPKVSEIIQIWQQTKKVLQRFEEVEKFNEEKFSILMEKEINDFKTKWT